MHLLIAGLVLWILSRAKPAPIVTDEPLPDGQVFPIRNIINDLPINTASPNYPYKTRSLDQINKFIIHHSATNSGSAEAYANYHAFTRGWPGIGYHYVIDKDGTINQTNYWETISFHTSGENTSSIGICLTGNYDVQLPPTPQIQACVQLLAFLGEELGQFPVFGHRDFANKSCPGINIDTNLLQALAFSAA